VVAKLRFSTAACVVRAATSASLAGGAASGEAMDPVALKARRRSWTEVARRILRMVEGGTVSRMR
jgi:hypothetical protein